jgi:hypothetical protein
VAGVLVRSRLKISFRLLSITENSPIGQESPNNFPNSDLSAKLGGIVPVPILPMLQLGFASSNVNQYYIFDLMEDGFDSFSD